MATLINASLVTLNNATLIMFTCLSLLIICIYCILYHLLHLAYAVWPSLIHIFMYMFSFTPLDLCVLGSWEIVRLLVRYYCTVGTRSTSILLHSHQHLLTMWQCDVFKQLLLCVQASELYALQLDESRLGMHSSWYMFFVFGGSIKTSSSANHWTALWHQMDFGGQDVLVSVLMVQKPWQGDIVEW